MCYATALNGPQRACFFKSWKTDNQLGSICDAISASCSAPTYFKPYRIRDTYYVDGAVTTNTPSMCVLAEALKIGADLNNLRIANLQTGIHYSLSYKSISKLKGQLSWLLGIADLTMISSADVSAYQAERLLQERHVVISPRTYLGLDSLDFDEMDKMAEELWKERGPELIKLLAFT